MGFERLMSYGQQLLRKYIEELVETKFLENIRPEWLYGLELDFYFPDSCSAIEFNGGQHICVTNFTTYQQLTSQSERDKRKKELCKANNITLVTVEAIDLEYTRLRYILKRCKVKHKKQVNKGKLRALNKDATQYRKLLIEKYGCPSAHKRSKKPRKQAIKVKQTLGSIYR